MQLEVKIEEYASMGSQGRKKHSSLADTRASALTMPAIPWT